MRDALNATGRRIGYSICPNAARCNDPTMVRRAGILHVWHQQMPLTVPKLCTRYCTIFEHSAVSVLKLDSQGKSLVGCSLGREEAVP